MKNILLPSVLNRISVILALFFCITWAHSQSYYSLSGSTSATTGQTKTYNVYGSSQNIVYTNWSTGGANASISNQSNTSANITFNSGGTTYVNATVLDNYYNNHYLTLAVSVSGGAPSTPPTPSITQYCDYTRLTRATPPSGVTYYWQSSSSGTSTSSSASYVDRVNGSVYYLRARSNSSGLWSSSRSVSYSIKFAPGTPLAPSKTNNCGNTVLIRQNPPPTANVTYYWQSSASGTSTSNSGTSVTRTSGTQYYIRARSNTNSCWGPAYTINYTINTVPSQPSSPTVQSSSCGSVVLARSNPPSGYTWYWQSSSSATSTSNSSSTITRTSGSVYYLRARNNSTLCWSSASSVSYSISTPPPTPTTPTVSQMNCDNTVLARANPPGGVTWYWQSSSSGTSTSNSTATVTRTNGSVYYLRARSSAGCWSTSSASISYSINYAPGTPLAPTVENFCGSTVLTKLAPPPTSDLTYYWQTSAAGTSTANTAPQMTFTSGTQYFIKAQDDNSGCWGPAYTINYVVNSVPTIPPAPIVTNNCGNTVLTRANPPGGSNLTYFWQTNEFGEETNNFSSSVTRTVGTQYFLRTQNTNTGCWGPTYTVNYSITPIPAEPTGANVSRCGPGDLDVSATLGTNGDVLKWYDVSTGGTAFATGELITTNVSSSTTYYAEAHNNTSGCASSRLAISISVINPVTWYLDIDGDLHASGTLEDCTNPGIGYTQTVLPVDDCDDGNDLIHPNTIWYADVDGDGLGDANYASSASCTAPITGGPWVLNTNDLCPLYASTSNNCQVVADPMDKNYVYSRSYQVASQSQLDTGFFTANDNLLQEITYLDGLGRPIQIVGINQSPEGQDILTHKEYDSFGREESQYLSYGAEDNAVGTFRATAKTDTETFYDVVKYENTLNPYSQIQFERSPLNRVLKQAAPGQDWQLNPVGDDHSVELGYETNSFDANNPADPSKDNVRQFRVTTTFANDTYTPILNFGVDPVDNITVVEHYGNGVLYKTITKDENHSGSTKNHTSEEFTDIEGRVVLKRTYADVPAIDLNNDGDTLDLGEQAKTEAQHDTYYVYDDFGNLTYVLPPKMEASDADLTTLQSNIDALGYRYVYDHRNRLVEKQIPGKGKEYIVYNKLDRPILTQDANQRDTTGGTHEWLFTKYDVFGRVAYTGKATSNIATTRAEIQSEVDGLSQVLWVTQGSTKNNHGNVDIYYDNGAYPHNGNTSMPTPKVALSEILTINYYDNYVDRPTGAPTSITILGSSPTATESQDTQGLPTVSRVKVLDTQDWINSLAYYDKKGRSVYSYSKNTYLGITDIVETQLDFIGKPLKTRTTHTRSGTTIVTIDNFNYDHAGRVLAQTQCIGDQTLVTCSTEELIASNKYDSLGVLEGKKVGGSVGVDYNATSGLQTVDYTYNVRGWLKTINNDAFSDNDLFDFAIRYNDPTNFGVGENPDPLYNGNISQTLWSSQSENPAPPDNPISTRYSYSYDPLNRIKTATDNTTNYNLSAISYDKNGNIMTLNRKGLKSSNNIFGNIDQLEYTYSGNQLTVVEDDQNFGSDTVGFVDTDHLLTDEYEYDTNGNMTSDANKGISLISYNHLNLPTQVDFASGNIQYVYDATGTKLKKTVSTTGTETLYANGYIYEGTALQFFPHPEGYITPDGSGGYDYVYQYKDLTNNVRLSYTDANGNGSIDPLSEIVEENNYYPFGLKHKGYNGNVSSLGNSTAKKFKFQGQELDESLGYNMYEFELRHYDPAIGRFVTTDPYEQFQSPYLAMGNNPVIAFDPDGGNCVDANGNVIACPDGKEYDEYRDNNENHINILDEVVLTPGNSEENKVVDNGARKITPDKFPAITELGGLDHTIAEIELNFTGERTVETQFGDVKVDAAGNLVRGPVLGGAGGMEFINNPANALKVVASARSIVKGAKLPIVGKIRFIPRPSDAKSGRLLKKNGGFVDKFGNIWKKGPSRTKGQAFEWDVQLSAKGKAQLGGLSRDGKHLNVSLDGKITH